MRYLRTAASTPDGYIATLPNDLMPEVHSHNDSGKHEIIKEREQRANQLAEVAGVFIGAANLLRAKIWA
jgi:hypothetical protein